MNERKFLPTKLAAEYLGLSPRTLEAYRVSGVGPPYLKFGGKRAGICLYAVADLDKFLDAHTRMSTSDERA